MQISLQEKGDALYVHLVGDLDEHNALAARQYVDASASKFIKAKKVILDLSRLSFMDSTGIGFLLGRYKNFRKIGLPVYIANPSRATDKILTIGGIYAVIPKL